MKATLAALVLLAAAGTLVTCDPPPEFSVPVSAPSGIEPDPRLVGDWYQGSERELLNLLRVFPNYDGQLSVLWLFLPGPDSPDIAPKWYPMTAYASVFDGVTYYNLQRVPGTGFDYTAVGETPGYIIVAPVLVHDDLLVVCVLHGDGWDNADAIKMFDAAGLTYRAPKAPEAKGADGGYRYLKVETDEAGLRALLRDEAQVKPFRTFLNFIRFGARPDELEPHISQVTEHIRTHGCPVRGWPPNG